MADPVVGDTGRIQPEAVEVRRPTDGGEDGADLHLILLAVMEVLHDGPVACGLEFGDPCAGEDLHPLALECRTRSAAETSGSARPTRAGPNSRSRTPTPKSVRIDAI